MKETKFRAWDKKRQRMLDMEYLLGPTDWEMLSYLDYILLHDEDDHETSYGDTDEAYLGASNYELLQFTGLRDTDGMEIYEGDVIAISDHESGDRHVRPYKSWVIFEEGCFDLKETKGYELSMLCLNKGYCKVIGNIYQNPELLNE